jgi:NAD(P)-dependent dehydrogenase (short-subunit alcohol dehydrogenase family)
MTPRFVGKLAVVTGGNSGIGLATAKAFAHEGARVIITGRDPDTLHSAVQEVGYMATAHRSDICDLRQIASLFAKIQEENARVDVLFVNAGVLLHLPIESVTEADWDQILDTNLKGAFFTVQKALPLMSTGSVIVLTGSAAAGKAVPSAPVYAASKAGLCSLGRSLAAALVERGIRVNVVSPAATETPIFRRAACLRSEGEYSMEKMIAGIPMKRMATPEEVAAVVLFLASESAAFVTGTNFLIDGGVASF